MRVSIYIACLLAGFATVPFIMFIEGLAPALALELGNLLDGISATLLLALLDAGLQFAAFVAVFMVVGMLAAEMNFLMALLLAAWPLYQSAERALNALTGASLGLSDMFYAGSVREVTAFGGLGALLVKLLAVLLAWLLVRKLLTVTGIRSPGA